MSTPATPAGPVSSSETKEIITPGYDFPITIRDPDCPEIQQTITVEYMQLMALIKLQAGNFPAEVNQLLAATMQSAVSKAKPKTAMVKLNDYLLRHRKDRVSLTESYEHSFARFEDAHPRSEWVCKLTLRTPTGQLITASSPPNAAKKLTKEQAAGLLLAQLPQ